MKRKIYCGFLILMLSAALLLPSCGNPSDGSVSGHAFAGPGADPGAAAETTTEPVPEMTTEPAPETTTEPASETTTEPAGRNNPLLEEWNAGMALYENGQYAEAAELFDHLASFEYSDSAEMRDKCYDILTQPFRESMRDIKAGDTILFGSYEQDLVYSKGTWGDDIEWIVLAREDDRVLVISKYVLASTVYHDWWYYVPWKDCYLRNWLNDFLVIAFKPHERSLILPTEISADPNPDCDTDPGDATIDKLFILSMKEAAQYFPTDESGKCIPTKYAGYGHQIDTVLSDKASELEVKDCMLDGTYTCQWWLRTPGGERRAAVVDFNGQISTAGRMVDDNKCGIRPAMWISIE